jgi:WD40 repeat protein
VAIASLGMIEAQDLSSANSRQGYPIPAPWEIARLPCTNAPLAICVSRDGKTLYADDFNGLVTVWDLTTRTKVRDLPPGENNNVERLVLSRDGSRLASCSGNGVVHVWDLKSSQLVHESHPAPNYADMAISPDGKTILTSGLDNPVRLIDVDTGKVLSEFKLAEATNDKPGMRNGLWNLSFLDDSKYGVGNGVGFESFVFDTTTGAVKAKLQKGKLIGLDATGKWLIGGDVSGLMFWSLDDIKKACAAPTAQMVPGVSVPGVDAAQVAALTTIPYDHWSLGSADPAAAKIIDPRWGLVWPVYGDEPRSFGPIVDAISPDGHYLYESWYKNQIRVLDLTKRPPPTRWLTGPVCNNFSGDSTRGELATNNLVAWERSTGLPLGCGTLGRTHPDCVYWQDGVPFELIQILNPKAQQSQDGFSPPPENSVTLEKINLQTREVVKKIPFQANARISVSQSGKVILVSYQSPPVHWKTPPDPKNPQAFFDPANRQTTPPLQILDADLNSVGTGFTVVPNQGLNGAVISPADKLVAGTTQNEKDTIRIFDLQSGHEVSTQPLISDHVVDFGVTDDGFVFVATTNGNLSCYHADTGEKVASVDKAHARPIRKLAVSPDNKVIATAGTDGLIKLWSVPDLKPLGVLDSPGPLSQEGIFSFGFYDPKELAVGFCPDPSGTSQLCLVSLPQAFDESKWNVNASAAGGRCLAISSDGKQVAIGEEEGALTVVDNSTGKQLYSVAAHSGRVEAVEFVSNSYQIKTYGADNKCRTWDLANSSLPVSESSEARPETVLDIQTGSGPKKISPHPMGFPNPLSVSPSAGPYQENEISPNYHNYFTCACALPGGQYLVLSDLGGLYLYSLKTERMVWTYDIPSNAVAIVYDPLHQQFITTHEDGVTRRWDLPATISGDSPTTAVPPKASIRRF